MCMNQINKNSDKYGSSSGHVPISKQIIKTLLSISVKISKDRKLFTEFKFL